MTPKKCSNKINTLKVSVKASNYLAKFQNLSKLTQIFLNFLHDIRSILIETHINSLCSFTPMECHQNGGT